MDDHTPNDTTENPSSHSPRFSRHGFTYEHFPVVCPTCEGKGEIEEDLSGMITFVPVRDKRLRPAWIKVKISVLLLIILCIGGLSTYFLYPHDVKIFVTSHEVQDFDFHGKIPWILYEAIQKNIDHQLAYLHYFCIALINRLVGKEELFNAIHIGIRTTKQVLVTMNMSYEGDTGKFMRQECFKHQYDIPQLLLSSAEVSYWMHSEHVKSKDDYFYTDCSSMVFPLPTKMATTTVTTSTAVTVNSTISTTAILNVTNTAVLNIQTISNSSTDSMKEKN